MKVRMKKTASGPWGVLLVGKVYDIGPDLAQALESVGAVEVLEPKPAEAAAIEPEEKTIMPKPRPKKRGKK